MIGLLAATASFPRGVRTNDDPIFDRLRRCAPPGAELFRGYERRHVLADGESIVPFVCDAARRALGAAGVEPGEVGALIGRISLGERLLPSGLADVHCALGLSSGCWVLPLGDDFTNALTGMMLAAAMIRAHTVESVLIAVGGDWTRRVAYDTAPALSAADGAAALVVARSDTAAWSWVGARTTVASELSSAMVLPFPDADGTHFELDAAGREAFLRFGAEVPPKLAVGLLRQHGAQPEATTLVSHQASALLLERWRDAIRPAAHLDTLAQIGNVTVANIAATLALRLDEVQTDWLLLVGVGPMQHAVAALLRRNPAACP